MTLPLLPTTMVGSYPRPGWFHQQLSGRDVFDAFKDARHKEAFEDAVRAVIGDQGYAGLDLLTDGQMWFDDYENRSGSVTARRTTRRPRGARESRGARSRTRRK